MNEMQEMIHKEKALENVDLKNKKCILMTAHRRENLGQPLENICNAVKRIVEKYEDIEVVYPVHLNPAVQEVAHRVLDGVDRVHLVAPLDVEDMHNIMDRSFLVMTDSGGLQLSKCLRFNSSSLNRIAYKIFIYLSKNLISLLHCQRKSIIYVLSCDRVASLCKHHKLFY